jgi:hypothetical protein
MMYADGPCPKCEEIGKFIVDNDRAGELFECPQCGALIGIGGRVPCERDDVLVDVETLAARADNYDRAAQDELKAMAISVGYSETDIERAKDWAAVAKMVAG